MQVFEYIAGYGNRMLWMLAGTLSGALLLIGCEDPGSVGSGFVGEETRIVTDTLQVEGLQEHSFTSYSGNLPYFSAGAFEDPLFGDVRTVSYLKPDLPINSAAETFLDNADMRLELFLDQRQVYGDSARAAEFDLVEVGEVWRGGSVRLGESLPLDQANLLGSFTVGDDGTAEVEIAHEWVSRYRDFFMSLESNRDSLYRFTFPGLALVPRNSDKMIAVNPENSMFVIDNPGLDTVEVGVSTWAYSLERTVNDPVPEGRSPLHGTLESVLSFDLPALQEAVGSINVSRVELVIYEDSVGMENALDRASSTAGRPDLPSLRLHRVERGTAPESLDPGTPLAAGVYDPDDAAFHFDLTTFVRTGGLEASEGFDFYITGPPHDGVVRSSLIYNNEAPPSKRPKLIVTSVQTVGN